MFEIIIRKGNKVVVHKTFEDYRQAREVLDRANELYPFDHWIEFRDRGK